MATLAVEMSECFSDGINVTTFWPLVLDSVSFHPTPAIDPTPQSAMPTLSPIQQWHFSESNDIGNASFDSTGQSLYIHLRQVPMLDVLAALVHYWPELTVLLSVIVVACCALRIRRVLRRPQSKGSLYCAVCNYELVGLHFHDRSESHEASVCPECSSRMHLLGNSLRTRLTLPVTVIIIAIIVALSAGGLSTIRSGNISNRANWHSESLLPMAKAILGNKFPPGLSVAGDKVIEIDIASGRDIRTICRRPYLTWFPAQMPIDRRTIILARGMNALDCIDMSNGSVLCTLERTGLGSQFAYGAEQIVMFADDTAVAYVVWANSKDGKAHLLAWDLQAGTVTSLLSEDAYRWVRKDGSDAIAGRRFVVFKAQDELHVLTSPKVCARLNTISDDMHVYTISAGTPSVDRPLSIDRRGLSYGHRVIGALEDEIYCIERDGSIVSFDSRSGQLRGTVEHSLAHPGDDLGQSNDGNLVFVTSAFDGAMIVRDLSQMNWIARLNLPANTIDATVLDTSRTGKVAVRVICTATAGYSCSVILFDLSSVYKYKT